MAFLAQRLVGLRKAKGIRTQEELESTCGISRSMLNKYEKDTKVPTADALEMIATSLDADMGYFHGQGDHYADTPEGFDRAAVEMSFRVFSRDLRFSEDQKERCRRVLSHSAAPRTAAAWCGLAEMIDLVVGPSTPVIGKFGA